MQPVTFPLYAPTVMTSAGVGELNIGGTAAEGAGTLELEPVPEPVTDADPPIEDGFLDEEVETEEPLYGESTAAVVPILCQAVVYH